MMPKVSVLVPVYGVEKYIRRCALSLFNQTLQEVEFIFINDCTKDRSIAVLENTLKQYPACLDKVKILHHSHNRGSAAARNTGLDIATGEYIIVIDGDDYIEPNMLEELYNMACKDCADIIVSDYWIDFKNKVIYKKQMAPASGIECLKELLKGSLHASTSNKLIARKLFVENKIEHIEGINFGDDMSILFRLFYFAGKVSYSSNAYLHYVQYNTSSYTQKLSEKSRQNIVDIAGIVYSFFIENKISDKELWQAFDFYKLSVKSILLISCGKKEREKYLDIYSESSHYLFVHPTLPLHYKWIVHLAIKHKIYKLNFLLALFNLVRRYRR